MNFITDLVEGESILRSVDILVFGWAKENTDVWILQECPLLLGLKQWFCCGTTRAEGGI